MTPSEGPPPPKIRSKTRFPTTDGVTGHYDPGYLKKIFRSLSFIKSERTGMTEIPLMSWDDSVTFSSVSVMDLITRGDTGVFWNKCFCPLSS